MMLTSPLLPLSLQTGSAMRQRQWSTSDDWTNTVLPPWASCCNIIIEIVNSLLDIAISLCHSAALSTHTGDVSCMEAYNHRIFNIVSPIVRLVHQIPHSTDNSCPSILLLCTLLVFRWRWWVASQCYRRAADDLLLWKSRARILMVLLSPLLPWCLSARLWIWWRDNGDDGDEWFEEVTGRRAQVVHLQLLGELEAQSLMFELL